jgi:hypothetical protein
MKKKNLFVMLLAIVMMFIIIPADTNAATKKVPVKVMNAVNKCVDENGRCIVVDNSACRVYLFKKTKSGKWELKKDFRCTVGDYINPNKHYFLLRNADTDKLSYKEGSKTFYYGMYIDCYEEESVYPKRFHSYGEKGKKVYKLVKHNPNGIGLCVDNVYHIWKYYKNGTAVMGC